MTQRTHDVNDVVLTSMRRNDVASTLIRPHFGTKCPLVCALPLSATCTNHDQIYAVLQTVSECAVRICLNVYGYASLFCSHFQRETTPVISTHFQNITTLQGNTLLLEE